MVKHTNFKTQAMMLTKFSVWSKALFPFITFLILCSTFGFTIGNKKN